MRIAGDQNHKRAIEELDELIGRLARQTSAGQRELARLRRERKAIKKLHDKGAATNERA